MVFEPKVLDICGLSLVLMPRVIVLLYYHSYQHIIIQILLLRIGQETPAFAEGPSTHVLLHIKNVAPKLPTHRGFEGCLLSKLVVPGRFP